MPTLTPAQAMTASIVDRLMATMPPDQNTPAMRAQITSNVVPLAAGIVDYLSAHVVVSVTVTPATAGLQRDPVPPSLPTLAPTADVVLGGALTLQSVDVP